MYEEKKVENKKQKLPILRYFLPPFYTQISNKFV